MRGLAEAMTLQNVIRAGQAPSPEPVNNVVRNGLIIYYDGIANAGFWHKNDALVWIDQSGNGNHGSITDGVWGDDELFFNGSSTWVNCGEQNYPRFTIEVLLCPVSTNEDSMHVASNYESGGYAIARTTPSRFRFGTHRNHQIDADYENVYWDSVVPETYYLATGVADEFGQSLYINGEIKGSLVDLRTIDMPQLSNVFALGCNPSSSGTHAAFFQGRIKSFRFYNRVLTAAEIAQNWQSDKARFGL